MRTKNLLARRPTRCWLNVEVRAEDIIWVIAAFHFGEAGKRRGWIGRVEGSILICAEEAHVGSRPAVRREQFSLEVGGPSIMAGRLREIGKRGVQPNQSRRSRCANAVASFATRATAPPSTRILIKAVGELGFAIRRSMISIACSPKSSTNIVRCA